MSVRTNWYAAHSFLTVKMISWEFFVWFQLGRRISAATVLKLIARWETFVTPLLIKLVTSMHDQELDEAVR